MTESDLHRLARFIGGQREAMVDLLRRLIAIESPSDKFPAAAEALDLLAAELTGAGLAVRRMRGRRSAGTLYATLAPRTKRRPFQLLVGHCDTVWPLGTLRERPVTLQARILRGPGALDMKGGLAQLIFALRAIHELALSPPATCVVVIDSDEEVGTRDAAPLLSRLARGAARAYILEPAYGPTGKLKTARKSAGSFEMVVKGRAAHAGVNPEEGISAILEMSLQVQRLFALNDPARGISVNVGTIDGGLRPNVIAPEVRAAIDVRVPTLAAARKIEDALHKLKPINPLTTVEMKGHFGEPPMEPTPRNQALWRQAHQLGLQLGLELDQAAVGGASDGNTTSQYTATLDGLGAVGLGMHAVDEQVEVARMPERCALLVMLLLAPLDGSVT